MAAGTVAQFKDLIKIIKNSEIIRIHYNQGFFIQKPYQKKFAESTIEFSITNNEYQQSENKERNVTLFVREMDKNTVRCTMIFDNVGWVLTNSSADKLAMNELVFRLENVSGEAMPLLFSRWIEGK
jgi:hypothetical protein